MIVTVSTLITESCLIFGIVILEHRKEEEGLKFLHLLDYKGLQVFARFSSSLFTNFKFFRLVLVLNGTFVWSNVERFSSLEGIK